jgi:hypothetical protein
MPNGNIEAPDATAATNDRTLSASAPAQTYEDGGGGWAGALNFAGTMAVVIGVIHAVAGLTALFKDEYFFVARRELVVSADYSAWGWAHLAFGALAIAVGWGIIKRQPWARIAGIIFAGLSIVLNLGFLDAQPVWSTMVIAFDVILIWALTVHGDKVRPSGSKARWTSPYGPT